MPFLLPSRGMRRAHLCLVLLVCSALAADGLAAAKEKRLRMARPKRGSQIMVGPVLVPQGSEVTECTYLKLPSKRDLAVNRVRIKVKGGSHHIHLYRPMDPTKTFPDGHETCDFALNFDAWQLILASQNPVLDWKLPPGIAFHFRAGEQLLAQTHFVDAQLLETSGSGWAGFNLHAIPARKVKSYAGSIFGQDRDVVVPPGTSTATTRCVFPKPVKLLGLTGHYHFRGVEFSAAEWDGTATGRPLYRTRGYEEPVFTTFGAGDIPEIRGIEWTCVYENPTDQTFVFGPFTDRNEHCNLFAFYYPTRGTNEFLTCVQQDGVTTVAVRN